MPYAQPNYRTAFCAICGETVKANSGHYRTDSSDTICMICFGGTEVVTPATIQQVLTGLELGQKTILDIVDGKVEFRLVKEAKPLAISPPKQHAFQAVDGFVAYLKKYGGTDTVVLCDSDTGRCQATLNEKAANGFEVCVFTPKLHPTFAAWSAILNRKMSAMELATFIQQQRRCIVDGATLASTLRQVKASTKIELNQGQGNGATNGITYTTKIQGKEGSKDADLPETIIAEMPLFIDSEEPSKLELDLVIEGVAGGTGVIATITAPTLDLIRFDELKDYAKKFDGMTFAFGAVNHGNWKFID